MDLFKRTLSRHSPFLARFAVIGITAAISVWMAALSLGSKSRDLHFVSMQVAQELDRLLQLRQQQVFTIAAFPSIRAFAASTPETRTQRAAVALNELQAWVASDTNVREAFIVDEQGISIMTTNGGWGESWQHRGFIREALAGRLSASPVARDRGEFSTYYAAPILDNRREIAGALVARVAAQELWNAIPRGEGWFATLVDENGVRLADTGDVTRRLMSFGTLDARRTARIAQEQTYGAQQPVIRATNYPRAQDLLMRGALDELRASDLGASAIAAQRLVSKPWTVLVIAPQPSPGDSVARLAIPLGTVILTSLVAAFLLKNVKDDA